MYMLSKMTRKFSNHKLFCLKLSLNRTPYRSLYKNKHLFNLLKKKSLSKKLKKYNKKNRIKIIKKTRKRIFLKNKRNLLVGPKRLKFKNNQKRKVKKKFNLSLRSMKFLTIILNLIKIIQT